MTMDIAGAKALKERLGSKGTEEAPADSVVIPEDAPPVYRWTGVKAPDASGDAGDEPVPGTSLFSGLALGFR
jgi:hypothetical protein